MCGSFFEFVFRSKSDSAKLVSKQALIKRDDDLYRLYLYRSDLLYDAIEEESEDAEACLVPIGSKSTMTKTIVHCTYQSPALPLSVSFLYRTRTSFKRETDRASYSKRIGHHRGGRTKKHTLSRELLPDIRRRVVSADLQLSRTQVVLFHDSHPKVAVEL